MNRKLFFAALRRDLFNGALSQQQVDGIDAILNGWEKESGLNDDRWLAYMLATVFHETARTMQPIKEYGGHSYYMRMYDKTGTRPKVARALGNVQVGDGARFCGRGYVQLTGRSNYARAGEKLGIDFLGHPELVMEPKNAARIMFLGMTEGWFTSKRLSDYLASEASDWEGARRVINSLDKAATIAGYAKAFYAALSKAQSASPIDRPIVPNPSQGGRADACRPDRPPDPIMPLPKFKPPQGGFFNALIGLLKLIFGRR